MPISNASAYSFNTSDLIPSVPYINANVNSSTAEQVESAASSYMERAQAYADAYALAIGNRDYVKERLMYDLCLTAGGITDGANLQENTISLHEKANELYSAAAGARSLNSVANINATASAFDAFYQTYYMDDAKSACILDTGSSRYLEPVTYDGKAVSISAEAMLDATGEAFDAPVVFVNDIPNRAGTVSAAYTSYLTETVSGSYENTPQYTVSYNAAYDSGESETVAAWEMKTAGESAVTIAYTTDQFGPDASWTNVAYVSGSSSEEESSEEPSSSSEGKDN